MRALGPEFSQEFRVPLSSEEGTIQHVLMVLTVKTWPAAGLDSLVWEGAQGEVSRR